MAGQPRKQRKARFTAPLHMRQKLMSVHLSKELKAKLGTKRRALPVRKGDRVRVMRGKHAGHSGKVSRVDLGSLKIFVEGIAKRKARGAEVPVALDPSNVMIVEADLGDKERKALLERSAAGG